MADSEDKRILRNYDPKLAATGFECAMITGSYSSGNIITLPNPDVETYGVVSMLYGNDCQLDEYRFDKQGFCLSEGYKEYRLMLIEGRSETISEASLEAIVEALGEINTTLSIYVNSVDEQLRNLKSATEELKSTTEELERVAEDLDQRVTALEEEEEER